MISLLGFLFISISMIIMYNILVTMNMTKNACSIMKNKNRLAAVSAKVPKCDIVYDIGSDHAYLPIHLVLKGVCSMGYATDSKEGPLKNAALNVDKYKMGQNIRTLQGYGLDPVFPGEKNFSIAIAGIGGMTCVEIFEKGREVAEKANAIIVQPMNRINFLRKWLYDNKFEIYDEELVSENDKIYSIIAAKYSARPAGYTLQDLFIGRIPVEKRGSLFYEFLRREKVKIDKILNGMRLSERLGKNGEDIDRSYIIRHGAFKDVGISELMMLSEFCQDTLKILEKETRCIDGL